MKIDLRNHLRPGDTVVVGQGTAEPRSLVEALIEQRRELAPLRVLVGASFTGLFEASYAKEFQYISFGAIGRTSRLAKAGVLSILPIHIGSLPALILSGRLHVDAALIQVSTETENGQHSLGLVADYLQAAITRARVTLAELNPNVPFTHGDTLVKAARIDATVHDDRRLITVERRAPLPEDDAIGRLVADLIPNGATLQLGIGGTPDAILAHLYGKKDLGVHSGLISDAVLDLVEAGVVTNRRKEVDLGITVTGALFGADRLYSWANHNRTLAMRSLNYTHDPRVLSSFSALYAINSAIEVDLGGQVNSELAGGEYLGAVGGQGAFARAALMSASGRSIVALPATARNGTASRIVRRLADGTVSTTRADADVIVTEHGIADLRGASLAERAERLAAIADPRFRASLRGA